MGAGPKTREWESIRRKLKPRFEAAGITKCEFRFDGCWRGNFLSFVHYDKRRYLNTEQLWIVALGCVPCHQILERMPRTRMKDVVLAVIANRPRQP